jgi:LysM repeat protein
VQSRSIVGSLVVIAGLAVWVPCARAEAPHVVQPGETLWSISASNNLTTRTVAAYNGLSEDAQVVAGQTIQVPAVDEGAEAPAVAPAPAAPEPTSAPAGGGASHTVAPGESLSSVAAANGITVDALASANGMASDAFLIEGEAIQVPAALPSSTAPALPGMASIPSPWGPLQLRADAAQAWIAMRAEALRLYGVELQPEGPLSAYRTYEQQAELYDLYLSGQGAPAKPPGSSSHELGLSVDVATPEMRSIVDQIGGQFGWGNVNAPGEWWHLDYVGG